MQLEVRDGFRTLWVEEFACFLENGELAFSYHELPDIAQPGWYGSPQGSLIREEQRSKNPEHPIEEIRSLCCDAAQVVSFYGQCIEHGGLVRTDSPVVDHALEMTGLNRVEPGFYAESAQYRFSVEVYQHKSVSFWRVKHGEKLPASFRSKKEPKYLILVSEEDGRLILRNPDTGDELWAPSTALTEGEPRHAQSTRHELPKAIPISWSLLPEWMQLDIEPGTEVTASPSYFGGTLTGFSCMKIKRDAREALEACLDRLDTCGFDGSGIACPSRSYYLRPMTGGRHIEVRIQSEAGDVGQFVFVDTLAEPVLYAYYSTPRTLEAFLVG